VQPFFEWLGPALCQQIEAVAMDMYTAFDLAVQSHCPNTAVVYDLFHVIAKFGRWPLLRNQDNPSETQASHLRPYLAGVIASARYRLLLPEDQSRPSR